MKFNYNGLWKALIDNNMKKKDLIDRTGISPTTISKMVRGDAVSLTIIGKICEELGTDIGDLICIEKMVKEDKLMAFTIDVYEGKWSKDLLQVLLVDRTTNRNIIWGTDDYELLGREYHSHYPILFGLITGENSSVIQPRILKTKESQGNRTKGKAEVFTPSWVCNAQNNLVDNAWFGRENVFNKETEKGWETTTERIQFPDKKDKTWQKYVDEKRLEIACGEAPYLVSRYDTVSGEHLKLKDRIGMLD